MRASDALATQTATYAIPLLILVTTGSTSLTGVAFLLEWMPRLVAFTLGGPLVDRFLADRVFRTAALARTLLCAAAAAALALLPEAGTAATVVVMTVGAAGGLLSQASFLAVETLGAHASRRAGSDAHRVQSVQIGIDQSALLAGPLLGGLLLAIGPTLMLTVVAALSATAAVSTTTLVGPTAAGVRAVAASLRTGWHTVRGIPALAWLVTGLVASNLALGVTQASAPITVMTRYGDSSVAVGAVWSAAGLVSLAAVAACRRSIDRFGLWPVGAAGAATACAACLATALAPNLGVYAVTIGVLMAGEGALTVVLRTLRARLIPAAVFGGTLSVTIVLIVVPMPVAGALVAVLPAAALPGLLFTCAVLQGVAMLFAFRGLWHHRASYATARTTLPPSAARAKADAPHAA
ncbi:MFS transporter [Streptomyces umbrinus]|uniref:MFS transporter n=1 Tax=Streptomyces umbrinus TaxID=67370 RepID=UPI0019AD7498|nr:MFS transporter [Streptomyces umbrinus]GHB82234.1 MFS transporter [Streptomyces umbrinus]